MFKRSLIIAFVAGASLLVVGLARAETVLPADQSHQGNYYAVSGPLEIAGAINGDVYAVGQDVVISGHVSGDILVIGQSVRILGPVDGNVRLVAVSASIESTVGKNISFIADTMTVSDTAEIKGSVSGIATRINLIAPVGGDLEGKFTTAILAAPIGHNVRLEMYNDFEPGLQILATARIGGDLSYAASRPIDIEKGAKISGQTKYRLLPSNAHETFASQLQNSGWWLGRLIYLFSLLLFAVVFNGFYGKQFKAVALYMRTQPAKSLWSGLILLIFIPILIVVAAITVIGIPLAVVLAFCYTFGFYIAGVWGSLYLGQQVKGKKTTGLLTWEQSQLIIGAILFLVLTSLPYVGSFIYFIFLLLSWGAVWQVTRAKLLTEH